MHVCMHIYNVCMSVTVFLYVAKYMHACLPQANGMTIKGKDKASNKITDKKYFYLLSLQLQICGAC